MMLAWGALCDSPTYNEIQHLVAGISHWRLGRFELFQVNPPLTRMLGALPVLVAKPETDWSRYDVRPGRRSERLVANDFVAANQQRTFCLVTLARWACIPVSLVGAGVCFLWGCELYGRGAGMLALVLWCSCPTILGHGRLLTSDVGAAAFGVSAAYMFWRWLRVRTWLGSFGAGGVLGFAELSKTTWIVLFPLWTVLWFAWRLPLMRAHEPHGLFRDLLQLIVIVVLGLFVLSTVYGFQGTFQRLGDYGFVSELLGGSRENSLSMDWERNRFAQGFCARIPVPLPKDYLMGIDVQKSDFEHGVPSYLRGQWASHGWWYYYLYALAIKVPLGTWGLAALAVGMTLFARQYSASWRDEMVVLAPFFVILIFISSETGFSVHFRYAIPALPFLFVWTSKTARVFHAGALTRGRLTMAAIVIIALSWSVGSSLAIYPHSLSYFNELAAVLSTPADASYPKPVGQSGEHASIVSRLKYVLTAGSRNGPRHLLDSNIDWGQDLLYLKDWLDSHPAAKLDGLAVWSSYPTTLAGIPETPRPPPRPDSEEQTSTPSKDQLGPRRGWYALSVNYIYARDHHYRYFLHFEPVAMAGYSIYIYYLTLEDANRVRREVAGRKGVRS
jgi:hypothetical protein